MKFILRKLSHRLKSHPLTTNMFLSSFVGFWGDVMCQTVYDPFTKCRPPLRRSELPSESASSSLLLEITSPYLVWQAWRRKTKSEESKKENSDTADTNITTTTDKESTIVSSTKGTTSNNTKSIDTKESSTKVLVDLRRSLIFCSFPLVFGVPFFLWVYRVLDKYISPHGITKTQALSKGLLSWIVAQFTNPLFLIYVTALDHFVIFRDGRDGRRRVTEVSHHTQHSTLYTVPHQHRQFMFNTDPTLAISSPDEQTQQGEQLLANQTQKVSTPKSQEGQSVNKVRTITNYLNVRGWSSPSRERVVLAGEDDDDNDTEYISTNNNAQKGSKSTTKEQMSTTSHNDSPHALFELRFPLHDSERELQDITVHKMGYFYRVVDNRRFNVHEYKNCVREDVEYKLYNDFPDIVKYGFAFWSLNWLPMFYYIPGHMRIAYTSSVQVVWSGIMSYLLHRKEGYETEAELEDEATSTILALIHRK